MYSSHLMYSLHHTFGSDVCYGSLVRASGRFSAMAPKACNHNGGKLHWHPAAIDDGVVLFSSDRHHIVFANWMRKAVRKIYGGDSTLNGLVGFTIDDRHCSCVCLLSGTVRWPQWLHLHGAGQTDQGFFDLERFDPPVKVDLAAM